MKDAGEATVDVAFPLFLRDIAQQIAESTYWDDMRREFQSLLAGRVRAIVKSCG
jgi:hypothetical protein